MVFLWELIWNSYNLISTFPFLFGSFDWELMILVLKVARNCFFWFQFFLLAWIFWLKTDNYSLESVSIFRLIWSQLLFWNWFLKWKDNFFLWELSHLGSFETRNFNFPFASSVFSVEMIQIYFKFGFFGFEKCWDGFTAEKTNRLRWCWQPKKLADPPRKC